MKPKVFAVLLAASILMLSGGCTMMGLLNEVPDGEFTSFEYHRAGNGTSADISALNAECKNGKVTIEELKVKADYGPFVNFNIAIKGWKREPTK